MTSIQVGKTNYPNPLVVPSKNQEISEDMQEGVRAYAKSINQDAVIFKTNDEVKVAYLPVSANPQNGESIEINGETFTDFFAIDNDPSLTSKMGKVVDDLGASVNEFFGNRIPLGNKAIGGVTLAAGAVVGGVVGSMGTIGGALGWGAMTLAAEVGVVGVAADQMTDKQFVDKK